MDQRFSHASLDPNACQLKATRYDRAASSLVSLLVLVGVVVLCLLTAAYSIHMSKNRDAPNFQWATEASSPRIGSELAKELENLSLEQSSEASSLPEPTPEETLAALTEVVARSSKLRDEYYFVGNPSDRNARAIGGPSKVGPRTIGPVPRVPRHQRWEVRFRPGTLRDYAQQLDVFGIEIGVIGAGSQVHYAKDFLATKPLVRVAPGKDEDRLQFGWQSGNLQAADRQLAVKAGIADRGDVIRQFFPAELEATMAALEAEFAGDHGTSLVEIRKTVFGVRSEGQSHTLYVLEQKYF